VGHNIIGFDLQALWKIKGKWSSVPKVLDTLVLSRFLWPERPWGHGLKAWGEHLGNYKGDFHEFDTYTQEMMDYCTQDVLLTRDVLYALEEECGFTLQGYSVYT